MTREEAVLKAINEGVKIRPKGHPAGFLRWESWSYGSDPKQEWESEPQQVTITLEQLEKAWDKTMPELVSNQFVNFKKELGFK